MNDFSTNLISLREPYDDAENVSDHGIIISEGMPTQIFLL